MPDIGQIIKLEEPERVYIYPGGDTVTIKDVTELVVRDSGTHRLKDKDGNLWIIAKGWLAIKVRTPDGNWIV